MRAPQFAKLTAFVAFAATLGSGIASIPGNPRWGLAPASMAWQGKTLRADQRSKAEWRPSEAISNRVPLARTKKA
jgi:hypothetical protein